MEVGPTADSDTVPSRRELGESVVPTASEGSVPPGTRRYRRVAAKARDAPTSHVALVAITAANDEHPQHRDGDVVGAASLDDAPCLKEGARPHSDAEDCHDGIEDLDRLHTFEYALSTTLIRVMRGSNRSGDGRWRPSRPGPLTWRWILEGRRLGLTSWRRTGSVPGVAGLGWRLIAGRGRQCPGAPRRGERFEPHVQDAVGGLMSPVPVKASRMRGYAS